MVREIEMNASVQSAIRQKTSIESYFSE
jgi:hypothetical protein